MLTSTASFSTRLLESRILSHEYIMKFGYYASFPMQYLAAAGKERLLVFVKMRHKSVLRTYDMLIGAGLGGRVVHKFIVPSLFKIASLAIVLKGASLNNF